ncbi:MAG: hypothetical protein HC779_06470 [Phyllobacteriaceae bacterium]|nr:hypothetical protein [Phyllobacteriaceae bacterium]
MVMLLNTNMFLTAGHGAQVLAGFHDGQQHKSSPRRAKCEKAPAIETILRCKPP